MNICSAVLEPVIRTIRMLVRLIREIVRTVCGWVTNTIRTVRQIIERVCQWLPWPFNLLCNLVTRLIVVIETVTEWVCREVIDRIINWVEIVLEYVYYVLRWVCWLVDWILFRWLELALCSLGIRPPKVLRVCVRILNNPARGGGSAVTLEEANTMMADAAEILARCNIQMVLLDTGFVNLPQFMTTTTCGFGATFSDFWRTFSQLACSNNLLRIQPVITVYFVEDMTNADGCAFPGTDWVIVVRPGNGGDGTVVVQEIGHLADLWGHSSDPNNVMTDQPGGTHDQIFAAQCCMIRSSRFVTLVTPLEGIVRTAAIWPVDLTVAPLRGDRGRRN